ncbi:MAG: UvrD-helicase domain-containing protein [bacterium]
MPQPILTKDSQLQFPNFTILKASAGSGKTHALSLRFVQFLLSEKIEYNQLRNMLAITFSNNAAKEMKERILSWLKDIYFGDKDKLVELAGLVALDKKTLQEKADFKINEILTQYTDLQVRTIDSFMTSLFKASAIDLGFPPEFEVVMDNSEIMEYAFNLYLRQVKPNSPAAELIDSMIQVIQDNKGADKSYLWNPASDILEEIKELYKKISALNKQPNLEDYRDEAAQLKLEIRTRTETLNKLINDSGLDRHKNDPANKIDTAVSTNHYANLLEIKFGNNPVTKPKRTELQTAYDTIITLWEELELWINRYREHYARTYYYPYLQIYQAVQDTLDQVKHQEGTVFIEDISKRLVEYINREIIPDIYFRLGDTIYHYLIDEFQDTSPIQWDNLVPLIENSLSTQGSLFIVGDTKQAIYGFRNADFEIMQHLVTKQKLPFASVEQQITELPYNYRSYEQIVQFNQSVFQNHLPEKYLVPAQYSGLNEFSQLVKETHKNRGYVETVFFPKEKESIVSIEKEYLQTLIKDLTETRHYAKSDIAILAAKNATVVEVSSWLNEIGIPFISYSELDIRKQKITGELIALLKFLDSPPDDLSFATFLLGDIFKKKLELDQASVTSDTFREFLLQNNINIKSEIRNPKSEIRRPLYKLFQTEFPTLWAAYFDTLFKSVGYLPLYDLTTEIYRTFDILRLHQETQEATLIKLLEVIKDFEGKGTNTMGTFLNYSTDEETDTTLWNISIPKAIDAVSIMSIHKAKGLQFPVVILLLYEERSKPLKYIFQDKGELVNVLKINRSWTEAAAYLSELYDRDRTKEMVDKLNKIYVAMTRPQSELYIIGIANKPSSFPLELLPFDQYPAKPNKPEPIPGKPVEQTAGSNRVYQTIKKPVHENTIDSLNFENRKRGELFHLILARLLYFDHEPDLKKMLDAIIKTIKLEYSIRFDLDDIKQTIITLLLNKSVQPYFRNQPNRVVLREQDIVDTTGRLFRIDRLIIDQQRVTILDFKTGVDDKNEPEYRKQLNHYLELIAPIYPHKSGEGYLVYIDLDKIVEI